jgi:class 3 adenylate cyclase/predicted ATPase
VEVIDLSSVRSWLEGLGLGQYADAFEANALDVPTVSRLSETDLRTLGVSLLGHRKKLMSAIAAMRLREPDAARNQLQLRHATMLFCDLVDSTAVSTWVDLEELSQMFNHYQACCFGAVDRFEGYITRFSLDGVLACFGYPLGQEEGEQRAIRAALELVRSAPAIRFRSDFQLNVRVGIASGQVIIGDLAWPRGERNAVIGEPANLAARLQAAARPGQVLISEATYRQAGPMFDCEALEAKALKGFPKPIPVWAVAHERAAARRFDLRREHGLTPYIERGGALEALAEHWRAATASGRVVVITGEAGIGKSRLVEELAMRIGGDSHRRVDYVGSPFHAHSPLHPAIAELERAAGWLRADPPTMRRAKLDACLASDAGITSAEAAVFAGLLSLPAMPGDPPPDADAVRRKRSIIDAAVRRTLDLAARRPTLVVCEDAHWFDPTTLEVVERMVRSIRESAALLVVTCRPGAEFRWKGAADVVELALERFDQEATCAMAQARVGDGASLPPKLLADIFERTEGIPLFVEEMIKAVRESAAPDGALPKIPASLNGLLMSRLDSVPSLKEIAQIGAAIGREFPSALLHSVARLDPTELDQLLARLLEADVLRRGSGPAGATYSFRHALLQDAAYESLMRPRRREIHRKIAEVLEVDFTETAELQPEVLAAHWEQADEFDPAMRYWKVAGQRAAERSANAEADVHFSRALSIALKQPDDAKRKKLELELRVLHGGVLRVKHGPPAAETGRAFARARELCREIDDDALLVPALSGMFAFHFVRAENDLAAKTADDLLALASRTGDRSTRMIGHRTRGMAFVHMGRLAEGRENLERSLSLYDASRDAAMAPVYGTDHAQTACGFLVKALWLLGLPEAAARWESWAVEHSRKVNHLFSTIQTAMFRITVRLFARDWRAAALLAHETQALANHHSLEFALNFTRFCLAACRCVEQPDPGALVEMRTAAEKWGALNYRPHYLALIAEAQGHAGDAAEGLRSLDEARAIVERTRELWVAPELLRLEGELMLLHDGASAARAESAFNDAIAGARQQSSRALELRATVSLARLIRRQGRRGHAREILLPVFDAFASEPRTPDLREAARLLDEL